MKENRTQIVDNLPYKDMSEQMKWSYLSGKIGKITLDVLSDDDYVAIVELIRSDVENGHQGPTIPIPSSVRELWSNIVEPFVRWRASYGNI